MRNEKRMKITVLFRNTVARCCAPSSSMRFSERSSEVSTCVEKYGGQDDRNEERRRLTMLFRSQSAKCCAPRVSISLAFSSSLISVCMKKNAY